MFFAFLLGLTGSIGHCTGMCSGIMLLLSRRGVTDSLRWPILHLGRITTYGLLGLTAGSTGLLIVGPMTDSHALHDPHMANTLLLPQFRLVQGGVSIVAAFVALYFALALAGIVPSPELAFSRISGGWGRLFRRVILSDDETQSKPSTLTTFGIGFLWGLLPCGLVLTALLTAMTAAAPLVGAMTMLSFGLGTWPAMAVISLIAGREAISPPHWMRYAAVGLVGIFALQLTLRGMAAWGIVQHAAIGGVILW